MTTAPTLLVDSGMHGDETEIIPFIERALKKYRNQLPPYMYIREVSPSAVRRRTRMNDEGYDLNRVFYDGSPCREVQSLIRFFTSHRFSLGVSFHMDLTSDAFYFYDSGNLLDTPILERFQSELERFGVPLLAGVDDPDDPILGDEFIRGYPKSPPSTKHIDDGTLWTWLLIHNVADRMLMPEIPKKISSSQTSFLVDAIFRLMIIPLLIRLNSCVVSAIMSLYEYHPDYISRVDSAEQTLLPRGRKETRNDVSSWRQRSILRSRQLS